MCPHQGNVSGKEETCLIFPPNSLRKKIGRHVALSEIFTPEKLKYCQQMLDQAHDEFVHELEAQLAAIGNEYAKAMENPEQAASIAEKIDELAFVVKKRMEALNFVFGYNVAKSLCEYIHETPARNADAMLVVCKHLAVLNIILKDGIKGDGGKVGQEMLANLRSLIAKTRKE